ncbi:MAG TPA: hypothetical protein VGI60_00850 [Chthoniobacterales bacterium]
MTVVVVVDLLFSAVGFVLSLLGIAAALLGAKQTILVEGSMGMRNAMAAQQALSLHLLSLSLYGLLVSSVALVSAVALFLMWRSARPLNLTYASLAIARGLAVFCFPALSASATANGSGIPARLIGLCLSLVYPGILLMLFSRRDWKVVFATKR